MKLIFLDTETTGNDLNEDRLCQVCYKFEDIKNEKGETVEKGEIVTKNFKPPIPISIKAMSVTNITNKMVENEEPFKDSETAKNLQEILDENILVAHNAKFDIAMLESDGIKVPKNICTLRLARYLDNECEIPEYSLQFLRYYYEMELDVVAHSAEGDVLVLEALFNHLYKKAEEKADFSKEDTPEVRRMVIVDRMLDISAQPSLIRRFVFGKYNGRKLAEIAMEDRGYLEWLLRTKKEEDDEDWIYTLEHFLKK
jgi:DNA polymerase III alpha subunit (gram-positive type)